MADVPFTAVSDLAAWVGQEIPADDPRALALLTAASHLAIAEIGAAITDEWSEVPGSVQSVIVQAAARVWFNPQGLIADAIDDYSRRWESPGESGIYFTDAERATLLRYRSKGVRGLWTLGTTRGDIYADQYLDVINADGSDHREPMPFLPAGE